MLRTHVDEMNVHPVDVCHELRQGVQPRLALAPIVISRPIARELLSRRKLHSLRCISHYFPVRPICRLYAPAQFGKFRFRNIDVKRTNSGLVSRLLAHSWWSADLGRGHGVLL